MKYAVWLFLLVLAAPMVQAGSSCGNGKDVSDAALVACAQKDLATADKKLNEVYAKLMKTLDAEGQRKLRDAQRAWVTFRDLNAAFSADVHRGGTAEPLELIGAKTGMTEVRAKELQGELELR